MSSSERTSPCRASCWAAIGCPRYAVMLGGLPSRRGTRRQRIGAPFVSSARLSRCGVIFLVCLNARSLRANATPAPSAHDRGSLREGTDSCPIGAARRGPIVRRPATKTSPPSSTASTQCRRCSSRSAPPAPPTARQLRRAAGARRSTVLCNARRPTGRAATTSSAK